MNNRKKAIIDIDNTLWQFCDALYEELRKINKSFPPPDSWTNRYLWEKYCTKDDFFQAINTVHFNQDSDGYMPYPEAKGFLSALKEYGYYIIIASHREPTTRKQTIRWLSMHGLLYDILHLSFKKTDLFDRFTSVVVDDAPEVLEKAIENGSAGTGLLFPWNREYANKGYKLFSNLDEVLNHILSGGMPSA